MLALQGEEARPGLPRSASVSLVGLEPHCESWKPTQGCLPCSGIVTVTWYTKAFQGHLWREAGPQPHRAATATDFPMAMGSSCPSAFLPHLSVPRPQ